MNEHFHITALALTVFLLLFACPGSAEDEFTPKCEYSHSVSSNYETNDNIFQVSGNKDDDTLIRNLYSSEMDCRPSENTSYSVMMDIADINFANNSVENYYYEDFGFELRKDLSETEWFEVEADFNKIILDDDYGAAYEMSSSDYKWELKYGKDLSETRSIEFFFGHDQNNYELYETSNSRDWKWGAEYTYDFGNYSYLELKYENGRTKYYNETLYAEVNGEATDTQAIRYDRSNTFTVAVSKTISIYPLKYIEFAVEKTGNSSNSTETLDGENVYFGYDTYDDINYSLYYIEDFNDVTSLALYFLYDKTDYQNHPTLDDYYRITSSLNTILKYYYGSLTHALSNRYSLDFSFTFTDYESNNSDYVFRQKIYSLGLTRKL